MSNRTKLSFPAKTIGIDLGDRVSVFSVRGADGEVCARGKIPTTKEALGEFFVDERGTRVVYEVSTHSPWITWLLSDLGCETIVANPWRVKLITRSRSKCDRKDADLLSEFGFLKPSTLSPVTHRGPKAAGTRALITARSVCVRARTQLITCMRGVVKSAGHRLPTCTAETFHKRAWFPEVLQQALIPLRDQVAELSQRIRDYDREIDRVGLDDFPETQRLRQIPGVGPITALAFVLAVEDPTRFPKSRDVGSYFGLVPKVFQSGNSDPQLRITRAGDRSVRCLLVQCAQYILGSHGKDCDLRRHGEAIAARGGGNARKRAIVAVARKLSVLLHRLWVTGEEYQPLRNSTRGAQPAKAS